MAETVPEPATTGEAATPAGAADDDPGGTARTGMAAERTWLAWWRTALVASGGAVAIGRVAPQVLHATPGPYIVLGVVYGAIAVGLLLVGARRQRDLQRAIDGRAQAPLPFGLVVAFSVAGIVVAALSTVIVVART
jgi:uncharacterized membrane protein YidH (DUF202 family)